MNTFGYVGGNPVGFVDPLGLMDFAGGMVNVPINTGQASSVAQPTAAFSSVNPTSSMDEFAWGYIDNATLNSTTFIREYYGLGHIDYSCPAYDLGAMSENILGFSKFSKAITPDLNAINKLKNSKRKNQNTTNKKIGDAKDNVVFESIKYGVQQAVSWLLGEVSK